MICTVQGPAGTLLARVNRLTPESSLQDLCLVDLLPGDFELILGHQDRVIRLKGKKRLIVASEPPSMPILVKLLDRSYVFAFFGHLE